MVVSKRGDHRAFESALISQPEARKIFVSAPIDRSSRHLRSATHSHHGNVEVFGTEPPRTLGACLLPPASG